MYFYTAYDLTLQSEFAIPELTPVRPGAEAATPVRLAILGDRPAAPIGSDASYWIDTPGGKFLIVDGREILIQPAAGVSDVMLRTHLLGPVLAALLRLRGLLVLHASGITVGGGALLFMGDAGWGKSTLAQVFCADGGKLIADDVNAIQVRTDRLTVLPGYPQLKLWPDAATALHAAPPAASVHDEPTAKQYHRPPLFSHQALPLSHIYVLGPVSSAHAIQRLSGPEAFLALVRFSRYAAIPGRPDLAALHCRQCAQVASTTPVSLIHRQRSLAHLRELAGLIKKDRHLAAV